MSLLFSVVGKWIDSPVKLLGLWFAQDAQIVETRIEITGMIACLSKN